MALARPVRWRCRWSPKGETPISDNPEPVRPPWGPVLTALPSSVAIPRELPGWEWLRAHDRGFSALRRATRAAVLMPTAFALGGPVLGNPALATFAALGSFAMLLLVDFGGSIRNRLQCQAALAVACMVLIAVGTLASRTTWLAAVVIAVLAFGVLFAGVVSSVLAERHHLIALAADHRGLAPGAGVVDSRPRRRLGPRVAVLARGDLAAVARPGARPGPQLGHRRLSRPGHPAARRDRVRPGGRGGFGRSHGGRVPAGHGRRRRSRRGRPDRVLRHPVPPDGPEHLGPRGGPARGRVAMAQHDRAAVGPHRAQRDGADPGGLRRQARRRRGARHARPTCSRRRSTPPRSRTPPPGCARRWRRWSA